MDIYPIKASWLLKNESKKKHKQNYLKKIKKKTNKNIRQKSYNTTPLESFLTEEQLLKLNLYDIKEDY